MKRSCYVLDGDMVGMIRVLVIRVDHSLSGTIDRNTNLTVLTRPQLHEV